MGFSKEDERLLMAAQPSLRAFAVSLTHNTDRANDLVQTTFMKAWDKADSYLSGTNLKAWLFTIMRNECYAQMRRRGREVVTEDGMISHFSDSRGVHSPNRADETWEFEELKVHFAQLPEDQREALIMIAEGFNYEEAAEVLGCAIGTIKSRVSRARSALLAKRDAEASTRPQITTRPVIAFLPAPLKREFAIAAPPRTATPARPEFYEWPDFELSFGIRSLPLNTGIFALKAGIAPGRLKIGAIGRFRSFPGNAAPLAHETSAFKLPPRKGSVRIEISHPHRRAQAVMDGYVDFWAAAPLLNIQACQARSLFLDFARQKSKKGYVSLGNPSQIAFKITIDPQTGIRKGYVPEAQLGRLARDLKKFRPDFFKRQPG